MEIGEVIAIFWTINNSLELHGLRDSVTSDLTYGEGIQTKGVHVSARDTNILFFQHRPHIMGI